MSSNEQMFEVDVSKVLPSVVTRTVKDGQILCPTCSGVGLVREIHGEHEFIVGCQRCHGKTVLNKCEHCNEYFSGYFGHRCSQSQDAKSLELSLETERREQETWDKAEKITLEEACQRYDQVVVGFDTFVPVEDVLDNIAQGWAKSGERTIPRVWGTVVKSLAVNTDDAIENRLADLHEDACVADGDLKDLRDFLETWCARDSVVNSTMTYFPDEKVAIVITEQDVMDAYPRFAEEESVS